MTGKVNPKYSVRVTDPVLTNSPLFKNLSELEFRAIAVFLEYRSIKQGEVIFHEGDAGEEMFILLSGEMSASVGQSDGTQRYMFSIPPGDFFGEMSIIANEPRSATIVAKEDSNVVALQGIDFYHIIYEYPMIGVKLLFAITAVQNVWLDRTANHLRSLMRWGEDARRRAITDDLTGLYNRRFLDSTIRERFENGSLELRKLTLMVIELNNIEEISKLYGSPMGDRVFSSVADILRGMMRSGDICARLEGRDEFAVLLPDADGPTAVRIAERVRDKISLQKITIPAVSEIESAMVLSVYTSIGIAEAPSAGMDENSLLDSALTALRRAKEKGRNQVELAN
jgi:diguanylate cyclase (GGDEF)-like protein